MTHFVPIPESHSAQVAAHNVASSLCSDRPQNAVNPLYLHGPTGSGKTLLVTRLTEEVSRRAPGAAITILQAGDFEAQLRSQQQGTASEEDEDLREARLVDLLIVEDLQHLCPDNDRRSKAIAEAFVRLFDFRYARHKQMVFTGNVGPGQLPRLPLRLSSRLGCGLVVGLGALQEASRLAVLQEKAQQRQLAVSREVLGWLAKHLPGGGRQLDGALVQLEMLTRQRRMPLDIAFVAAHFNEQGASSGPTIDGIAQRVGRYFRVEPRHLQSRRRHQSILLPRQVGMYLTRKLTDLSLARIGEYFGGRDHSTVLHACRKIEEALASDAVLSGAVRQLQADLS
ncbi:MAG TPA: DnaA/Hda family protein [Gemmataceae bacterium]|nr:DnaA/Hda family protein [Gemmataceae bacterium]